MGHSHTLAIPSKCKYNSSKSQGTRTKHDTMISKHGFDRIAIYDSWIFHRKSVCVGKRFLWCQTISLPWETGRDDVKNVKKKFRVLRPALGIKNKWKIGIDMIFSNTEAFFLIFQRFSWLTAFLNRKWNWRSGFVRRISWESKCKVVHQNRSKVVAQTSKSADKADRCTNLSSL